MPGKIEKRKNRRHIEAIKALKVLIRAPRQGIVTTYDLRPLAMNISIRQAIFVNILIESVNHVIFSECFVRRIRAIHSNFTVNIHLFNLQNSKT